MSDKEILQELCELDIRENRLKNVVTAIPKKTEECNRKLAGIEENLKKAEARLDNLNKKTSHLELDIDTLNGQLTKYSKQLMEVKTNKEYHSIQNEIICTKEKISIAEEELLTFIDEQETVETELKSLREANEKERAPLQEQVARFNDELKDAEIQLIEVAEKRKRAVEKLTPQMKGEYERVHQRYNGEAVVPLLNGTCKGCFVNVPPQIIEQLYQADSIIRCDNCGRFLYISKDE